MRVHRRPRNQPNAAILLRSALSLYSCPFSLSNLTEFFSCILQLGDVARTYFPNSKVVCNNVGHTSTLYACFSQPLEVVCIDVVQTGTLQYVANLISCQVVPEPTWPPVYLGYQVRCVSCAKVCSTSAPDRGSEPRSRSSTMIYIRHM